MQATWSQVGLSALAHSLRLPAAGVGLATLALGLEVAWAARHYFAYHLPLD